MNIVILNKANSQFSASGVGRGLCVLKKPADVLNMQEKKKKKNLTLTVKAWLFIM